MMKILEPNQTIMSVDPGETSGTIIGRTKQHKKFDVLLAYEITWKSQYDLKRLVSVYKPDWFVVEAFRLFPHKVKSLIGSNFPSCEIIGALRFVVLDYYGTDGWDKIVYQYPSDIKNVKILEYDRDWVVHSEHLKDAYKHLRRFVVLSGWNDIPFPSTRP